MKRYIPMICAALSMICAACSDDSSTSETCGNGVLDGGELCDGTLFADGANADCSEGKTVGTLVCSSDCEIDHDKSCVEASSNCNNGKLDEGEECDGEAFADGASANCGEGKAAGALVCTNCKIDHDKSCVVPSPTCGNGKLDEGEECDGTEFVDVKNIDICDAGKHLEVMTCSDSCHIDVEKSCADNDASLVFTQIAYSNRAKWMEEEGEVTVGGEMLFEVTNVGDGRRSSHCGLYWLKPNDNMTEWKAIERIYSFKDLDQGETDYICSNEYELYKDYEEDMLYSEFKALKPKCSGHIVEGFVYQEDRELGLGIVCDDKVPEDISPNAPYAVEPVEVVLFKEIYHYAQRRCDKTAPFGVIDTEKSSILDWSFGLESNYQSKIFVDDVGAFNCTYMQPIFTQIAAGEYGESSRYSAAEIANVGLGSDSNQCALYYYMTPPSTYDFPSVPIAKVADIPSIEPFKTYTICSESTKDYMKNLSGAPAVLKEPCDLYLSDDVFDYKLISPELKSSLGLNCGDISLVEPSSVTSETEGVELGDTMTIDIQDGTSNLLAIHTCEALLSRNFSEQRKLRINNGFRHLRCEIIIENFV